MVTFGSEGFLNYSRSAVKTTLTVFSAAALPQVGTRIKSSGTTGFQSSPSLFVEGKTDLLPGFVSKKNRKFAAHLTFDRETGKIGFEFAPREAKKKVAKKKSAEKTDDE